MGAHILAIKDMAGLCRPYAAKKLVRALKEEIGIAIHFHTHDTAGVQAAAVLEEQVKAVVEPADGVAAGPALVDELVAFCRERLAKYKCPKSIDFITEMPRDPNGKLYKRKLRDPYWDGKQRAI
jgi:acyl-coenzyme A synthetase/AMP-(fatty) acid ligase